MKEDPDRVLQSRPTDDWFSCSQEKNISMKIVLNQNDRVRRNAEESLNLRINNRVNDFM